MCGGGVGAVGWPGAYGNWWQADPSDRSVMVLLTHDMTTLDQLEQGIGFGAWDAITRFQSIGSAMLALGDRPQTRDQQPPAEDA